MGRKVVGITCGTMSKTEHGPRQALNRRYVWAVEQAGGAPVILPVTTDRDVIARYLGVVDGLLLSGGVDIDPKEYGDDPHPKLGEMDTDRDTTELPLIADALAQDVPLFAICRGIQALNVAMGGTLYQDLPSEFPSDIHHAQNERQIPRSQFTHSVAIAPDSRLRTIVGADTMQTNSLHHQALKDIPAELVVTARAEDGVVEAAEVLSRRYVVAVQFHPEETAPHDEKSRRLFEAFLAAL